MVYALQLVGRERILATDVQYLIGLFVEGDEIFVFLLYALELCITIVTSRWHKLLGISL